MYLFAKGVAGQAVVGDFDYNKSPTGAGARAEFGNNSVNGFVYFNFGDVITTFLTLTGLWYPVFIKLGDPARSRPDNASSVRNFIIQR